MEIPMDHYMCLFSSNLLNSSPHLHSFEKLCTPPIHPIPSLGIYTLGIIVFGLFSLFCGTKRGVLESGGKDPIIK